MIKFKDYLTEGRDAPLFHGTHVENATNIIESGFIKGYTTHTGFNFKSSKLSKKDKSEYFGPSKVMIGISLTRKFKVAKLYGGLEGYVEEFNTIFEFDQAKLAQRYRIEPVNYMYSTHGPEIASTRFNDEHREPDEIPNNEYEEFLIAKEVDISKYVKRIWTSKRDMYEIQKEVYQRSKYNHIEVLCLEDKTLRGMY